jgi:hypothetical protein
MKKVHIDKLQHGPQTKAKVGTTPWRSKHPQLTGHTRHKPLVEIRYTEIPVAKASKETTV